MLHYVKTLTHMEAGKQLLSAAQFHRWFSFIPQTEKLMKTRKFYHVSSHWLQIIIQFNRGDSTVLVWALSPLQRDGKKGANMGN